MDTKKYGKTKGLEIVGNLFVYQYFPCNPDDTLPVSGKLLHNHSV
jgi:hypothetical protein